MLLRPAPARPRRARRAVVGVLVGLLALAHLATVAAVPTTGGPRAPWSELGTTPRWSAPPPVSDARFATFPATGPRGEPGLWLLPPDALPLRLAVEQEVLDRFGEAEVREALTVWNGTPGSRFEVVVDRTVDHGVDERRRDGVHRVFVDRRSCGGRYLARAHLWPGPREVRDGHHTQYIAEVDLGLCDRLRPQQLAGVVRHELGHVAGLDHLCDDGEPCHRPGLDDDNTCRVMSPRAHPCQEPTAGDLDGLVHLHPRLPRAGGGDGRSTAAAVARATHPLPRTALEVVISPHDAPLAIRTAAATLAGHLGAPHLLVDDDCTNGPDGRALDRVTAIAGRVLAVGPVADACTATLQGTWSVPVETLADPAAAARRSADALGDAEPDGAVAPRRVLLAPAPVEGRSVPIAAVAGPAAVALGATLLVLEEEPDVRGLLRTLDELGPVEEVIALGDHGLISSELLLELVRAEHPARRLAVADAGGAATTLAAFPPFAQRQLRLALVAEDHPEHAVPAMGAAAASGGLLLPIDRDPRASHLALLRDRVAEGAIVGGRQAVSTEQQIALSRLVDGVEDP